MFLIAALAVMVGTANAQNRSGRLSLGTGLLYERSMDLTLAYEYETKYHNSWEFFANAYLKWMTAQSATISVPNHFGTTITLMDLVQLISHVLLEEETIMATYESELQQEVIQRVF